MTDQTERTERAAAPIVELEEATFAAQGKVVVEGVTLPFEEGKTMALVGPSGGGKSTVLKLAAGLIVPTDGSARFRGQDVSTMNRAARMEFRKESAFVFQDSALWANQNLRQILELPLKTHFPEIGKKELDARVAEVCAMVGYRKDIDIRPSQLSMGEQKLIAFARAMTCEPRLLFLDEWTESLDDNAARRLVALVRKRQEAGTTVIFVSHNLGIIREIAHGISMIVDGKLSLSVTAEEFANNGNLSKTIEKGIAL
jgi:ABC-type multidrug transport system ATPase subunit